MRVHGLTLSCIYCMLVMYILDIPSSRSKLLKPLFILSRARFDGACVSSGMPVEQAHPPIPVVQLHPPIPVVQARPPTPPRLLPIVVPWLPMVCLGFQVYTTRRHVHSLD